VRLRNNLSRIRMARTSTETSSIMAINLRVRGIYQLPIQKVFELIEDF
jgi:hypothetical protein